MLIMVAALAEDGKDATKLKKKVADLTKKKSQAQKYVKVGQKTRLDNRVLDLRVGPLSSWLVLYGVSHHVCRRRPTMQSLESNRGFASCSGSSCLARISLRCIAPR